MASIKLRRKAVIRKMSIILTTVDVPLYSMMVASNMDRGEKYILIFGIVFLKMLLIYLEYRWADTRKRRPVEKE